MAKPYSNDLRERVVAAIEAGHTREEVADLYDLALSTVGGFIKIRRPQDICPCTTHGAGQGARSSTAG
jgi:transposase